jgi:hypothetical protein
VDDRDRTTTGLDKMFFFRVIDAVFLEILIDRRGKEPRTGPTEEQILFLLRAARRRALITLLLCFALFGWDALVGSELTRLDVQSASFLNLNHQIRRSKTNINIFRENSLDNPFLFLSRERERDG